jgi:hypothetical protein
MKERHVDSIKFPEMLENAMKEARQFAELHLEGKIDS